MKKNSLILLLFCISFSMFSQKDYTINGETYQLKTEVEGTINLLWNTIDSQYRYFVEKDNSIIELVNSKNASKNYQEEYISTLKDLTGDSGIDSKSVKLTLPSLKQFINQYNASVDSNYSYTEDKIKLKSRLGAFGGITNNPFVENSENKTTPLFGVELELFDDNIAKRHALFFQLTHVSEKTLLDDEGEPNNYSSTEFALGYRFRFIYTDKFNIHANLKLVALNSEFDAPLIFGLGSDIKISNNSFITLYYNDLYSLRLDNQGNFSTNIAIGYKFNL